MDLPDFSELALLINSISHFLDEYGAGFFNEARLSFFQEMARELSEKASRDCEALYVGLIGGSGVGKSTLINAIAGEQISRPSDRRPVPIRSLLIDTRIESGDCQSYQVCSGTLTQFTKTKNSSIS